MHTGYFIGVFLTSWRLGCVRRKPEKTVWALGPLRFSLHRVFN